jgi:hypothetical protein
LSAVQTSGRLDDPLFMQRVNMRIQNASGVWLVRKEFTSCASAPMGAPPARAKSAAKLLAEPRRHRISPRTHTSGAPSGKPAASIRHVRAQPVGELIDQVSCLVLVRLPLRAWCHRARSTARHPAPRSKTLITPHRRSTGPSHYRP